MKTFKLGLIGKITLIVGIVELLAFSLFGYLYIEKYASNLEDNLKNRISIINKMISKEQLSISSLSDKAYISDMVGQNYIDGFVVGGNGFLIVSSKPKYLGQKFENLPKYDKEWSFNSIGEKFILKDQQLISIAYLNNVNNKPLYRTVIIIDTQKLNEQMDKIVLLGIFSTILFIALSSLIIVLFAKRIVTKRVDDSLRVLNDIETGDLTSQISVSTFDELGMLQSGINSMVQTIDKKTNDLSKNIAFLKSHKVALNESSIVTKSDLKGNITYANENFYKITGYSEDEVIGKPHNIVRHPENSSEVFKDMWNTIKSKKVWKGILKNKGKLSDYWIDATILPILDDKANIVEYIAVRHDITKMKEQEENLFNIAKTDALTGYGNRYKLNIDIKNSIQPALTILNVDNFALVNDFLGHEKGDMVIKKLGDIISGIIENENCELYHLQGDEYVVFNGDISRDGFINKMENLVSQVKSKKVYIDDEELYLNLTTAISFENKEKILPTADMALKVAKKENKHFIIYDDSISLNDEYENNTKWSKKIKNAIEHNKFIPVFQPIVNNKSNSWEKYECLVRMEDKGKLISPYFFLDISKKNKHYIDITKTMIKKSFEMFKDKDVEFSINLTIEDILNDDIKEYIFDMINKYQLKSKIVFEIVESESIENFEEVHQFISKVKSCNCKVAIDDFGTGYSNFEYLLKLEADYIKIDGSMIKDIDKNKDAQLVVSIIVKFANQLGMKTIAEYVENESILNTIKELGVDYSQGYYFSEPKKEIVS
jgi:PAS domain S-box-containing protein/diguanylate cyclase (GGDEF)-like protein